MWCKFGHVALKFGGNETFELHRVEVRLSIEPLCPELRMQGFRYSLSILDKLCSSKERTAHLCSEKDAPFVGFDVECLVIGVWCLVLRVWCLVLRVWCLGFGIQDLGLRGADIFVKGKAAAIVGLSIWCLKFELGR